MRNLHRKKRARELRERLERGPCWNTLSGGFNDIDAKEATRQYKIWAESWILGELNRLVPELAKEAKHEPRHQDGGAEGQAGQLQAAVPD